MGAIDQRLAGGTRHSRRREGDRARLTGKINPGNVIAAAAVQPVDPGSAVEAVIARAAFEMVVTRSAGQVVIAAIAEELVIAGNAGKIVVARAAHHGDPLDIVKRQVSRERVERLRLAPAEIAIAGIVVVIGDAEALGLAREVGDQVIAAVTASPGRMGNEIGERELVVAGARVHALAADPWDWSLALEGNMIVT